jgi:FKBP-type peptidyl-prolyl cis-trans isomerase FkpA
MARPFLIALLISPALISACGGGAPSEQPAATSPASESKPATPPTAEVTTPPPAVAPPPNTVGPALTPPPGTAAVKKDATKTAPEKPAFTRTDLRIGKGSEATKGKGVSVHYTGWLYDPSRPDLKGRMFDTSQERGPFRFVLGAGEVIPGWDEGFTGMKVGGRRRLIVPPDLAYGVDGMGSGIIPPNATLVFEMELLEVQE